MLVLGISQEHDSGVALVQDGKILFAANEERYTRKKLETAFPSQALLAAVTFLTSNHLPQPDLISVASIFHVSESLWNWFQPIPRYSIVEKTLSITNLDRYLWGSDSSEKIVHFIGHLQRTFRKQEIIQNLKKYFSTLPKIVFVDHHTCHAATACYTSGFKECLTVTMDGSGDGSCLKAFHCTGASMKLIKSIPFYHSPGHYYIHTTKILGFKTGQEGKVTGLSAHGDPHKTLPIFASRISYDSQKISFVNHGKYRTAETKTLKNLLSSFSKEDISAGIQTHLENLVTNLISDLSKKYFPNSQISLALSGGIFANVKLNQEISKLPFIKSLYVFPHMGDGGLAAGAALTTCPPPHPISLTNVYLGDPITNPDNPTKATPKLAKIIAMHLSRNKIVCLTQGRMEYGPRALGNRSIFAPATGKKISQRLNTCLSRSDFMPFAPIVRSEDLKLYFLSTKNQLPCLPFMTCNVYCKKITQKGLPAIVHKDNTARVQTVTRKANPLVWDILKEYKKITGLGVLINTSFNLHEEPIVRDVADAQKTFQKSRLDYLVVGSSILFSANKEALQD